jgi:hypothetical protein
MNENANWSMTNTLMFYKPYKTASSIPAPPVPNLEKLEYYIDVDPGEGNGKQINIPAGSDTNNVIVPIDINNLNFGSHSFTSEQKTLMETGA